MCNFINTNEVIKLLKKHVEWKKIFYIWTIYFDTGIEKKKFYFWNSLAFFFVNTLIAFKNLINDD